MPAPPLLGSDEPATKALYERLRDIDAAIRSLEELQRIREKHSSAALVRELLFRAA
jgi:hypothetical protein